MGCAGCISKIRLLEVESLGFIGASAPKISIFMKYKLVARYFHLAPGVARLGEYYKLRQNYELLGASSLSFYSYSLEPSVDTLIQL